MNAPEQDPSEIIENNQKPDFHFRVIHTLNTSHKELGQWPPSVLDPVIHWRVFGLLSPK